jgi:hypothetical protein
LLLTLLLSTQFDDVGDIGLGNAVLWPPGVWVEFIGMRKISPGDPVLDGAGGYAEKVDGLWVVLLLVTLAFYPAG